MRRLITFFPVLPVKFCTNTVLPLEEDKSENTTKAMISTDCEEKSKSLMAILSEYWLQQTWQIKSQWMAGMALCTVTAGYFLGHVVLSLVIFMVVSYLFIGLMNLYSPKPALSEIEEAAVEALKGGDTSLSEIEKILEAYDEREKHCLEKLKASTPSLRGEINQICEDLTTIKQNSEKHGQRLTALEEDFKRRVKQVSERAQHSIRYQEELYTCCPS